MSTPDMISPLIGWRAWVVGADKLLSPLASSRQDWNPDRAVEAGCDAGMRPFNCPLPWNFNVGPDHLSPEESCSCGFYSKGSQESVFREMFPVEWYRAPWYLPNGGLRVLGSCKVWGKVVRYRDGYRSQYAYPDQITDVYCYRSEIGSAWIDSILKELEHKYVINDTYRLKVSSTVQIHMPPVNKPVKPVDNPGNLPTCDKCGEIINLGDTITDDRKSHASCP